MRRHDRGPKRGGLIRMGIRSAAGGIGLISESMKARKESKGAKTDETEVGSTSHTHSEERLEPNRDVDAAEGPPPSYTESSDGKASPAQYADEQLPDQKASYGDDSNEGVSGETEDNLEEEWGLDDAQDEIIAGSSEQDSVSNIKDLEDTFIRNHPPPSYLKHAPAGKLSLPVVLPQRRPKDRSRGFIRAYAPMLENCGIDQATWLGFLDTFQKSSAANPWLNAINLASIGTMFIPHFAGVIVGYAIQQATNLAIELQARERTNNFLHKINDEFFRPRGLYCLVMTWNPESTMRVEQVNLTATVASRSNPSSGIASVPAKFRSSDGNTYGECDFPEVAPLIFPALDQLAAQTSADGVKEKTKFAKAYTFVASYWDKRATAEYAMTNPNSVLAQVPQERLNSRYADPNHPAASGSLISFVSGGRLIPAPSSRGLIGGITSVVGQAVRGESQGSQWAQDPKTGLTNSHPHSQYNTELYDNRYSRHYGGGRRWDRRRGHGGRDGLVSTPVGVYKKLLKKNVLYLMVVNMPSDEEMATAKTMLRQ